VSPRRSNGKHGVQSGRYRVSLERNGNAAESAIFSARYRKGQSGSAELEFLRLGKDGQGFSVQRRKPGIYRLTLGNQIKPLGQSADFRPQRSFAFSPSTLNKLGVQGEVIRSVGPALLDELGRIIYLGPVRRLAQRDYVWAGRMPAHIGDDGAKAVDALIASGVACQQAKRRSQACQRKPISSSKRFIG